MSETHDASGATTGAGGPAAPAAGLAHWDPYWPADFEAFAAARQGCPVAHSDAAGGYWIATRYADVQRILQDPGTFSSSDGVTIPHNPAALTMPPIDLDPPLQRDFRHLLNPCLSPRALASHAPSIRQFADTLIDDFATRGECEFMSDFARPLPAMVLSRVILQVDDVATMMDVQHRMEVMATGNNSPEATEAWQYLQGFARELLDGRRDRPPDGSVLSALVHGTVDGRSPTEAEQLGTIMILLLGGLETTTHAFGNVAYHMTREPDLEARVRDPEWTSGDLDEFLRLDPPVQWVGRTATGRCEVGGATLGEGEKVMAHLGSANRDDGAFADPSTLDFGRSANRHLTFGLGAHRCVGSHLARLELRVGFDRLLRRVRDVRPAGAEEVAFSAGMGRGPVRLPIAFDPAR